MPSFEGGIDEFSIYDYTLTAGQVAEKYIRFVPAANMPQLSDQPVRSLNLMAWNIWHGGRRHGREIGPQQVIDFIKETGTEIVMMQETYGSGALIADALDYYFYLASTNISVMSKYPILETWTVYDPFRCGVTTIALSEGQKINLASLWIHYLPAWRTDSSDPKATAAGLIKGEDETRHQEIKKIIKLLDPVIKKADEIPVIIGGDFNSPSHKDWIQETSAWHNGLIVEWPVSKVMMEAGFNDSFREIRPDLNYQSPTMTAERITYRIDYIYYKGGKLKAVNSDMHFRYKGIWPSDHPAVTSTLSIK
jgi:endonuclease/exonuclease/phosphatase family metal-dependent hydrolase